MVAKEIVAAMNCFEKIDSLDDENPVAIGALNGYRDFVQMYTDAVVAIGQGRLRISLLYELQKTAFRIPALIHPFAFISPSVCVGKGCIVEPMAVVHTGSVLGNGCIVSAGAVVNHNAVLADGCHVDCNAVVKAAVTVPMYTKIESGTVYKGVPQGIVFTANSPKKYCFEDGM